VDGLGIRRPAVLSNAAIRCGEFKKNAGIPDKLLKNTLTLEFCDVAFSRIKFN